MDTQQITSFALLSLGVIESLVGGAVSASGAVELFFHADNCLFVRKRLRQAIADEIMSRGVQLPDVFEALPTEEAQQEFQRELAEIRSLDLFPNKFHNLLNGIVIFEVAQASNH